jgi:NAD-dependent SIR2 family protein deacetylase
MTIYEDIVMQAQYNFSMYYGLYAQGKTAVRLSHKRAQPYEKQIQQLMNAIDEADCVIVGGASGLSAAGGGDFYYKDTPSFYKYFGKFAKKYGIKGAFAGMQYPFKTEEERWGYLATFLHTTQSAPIRRPYQSLKKLLEGKDFHIVTTNQDTQFVKCFPEDKVSELQGDHRFFQCADSCHDGTWDAVEPVEKMIEAMGEGTAVPTELIPKCPVCGHEAFPWVRGYGNFLQGQKYEEEYKKISDYLLTHKDKKILYFELGVGRMTPMFIQEPFWNLTLNNPQATYIAVNDAYNYLPEQIEDRGFVIVNDIDRVLLDAANYKETHDGSRND